MSDKVTTRISEQTQEGLRIKGYLLDELIGRISFGDLVYLLMTDNLPTNHEGQMIEAMLISCVDHGVNAPSVNATRTVASCGVPVSTAVAAGISAIGEHHGGAGAACAKLLQESLADQNVMPIDKLSLGLVLRFRDNHTRFPGLGHRIYKNQDPRAERLFSLANEWNLSGKAVSLIKAVAETWEVQIGQHLAINIDGAQGAILVDMGIPWQQAKGLFLIGRSAGLNAHAVEQIVTGKPFGFAAPVHPNYTGPGPRSLSK
jgi:citrate synthase